MLPPHGGRLGPERFLPGRIRCTSLGIFCTVRFSSAGFVTALSDRFRSGGRFPASSVIASILPGLLVLNWPVKCPLYARAIDIFGLRHRRSIQSFSISRLGRLIYKTAHSDVHHHPQRQEHEQHGRPAVTH